jgi:hypothetical protein
MPKGITLSEDEVGSVSSEMFQKFFLPELQDLSARYGGLGPRPKPGRKRSFLRSCGRPAAVKREAGQSASRPSVSHPRLNRARVR